MRFDESNGSKITISRNDYSWGLYRYRTMRYELSQAHSDSVHDQERRGVAAREYRHAGWRMTLWYQENAFTAADRQRGRTRREPHRGPAGRSVVMALGIAIEDADKLHHALVHVVEDMAIQHEIAGIALVASAHDDCVELLFRCEEFGGIFHPQGIFPDPFEASVCGSLSSSASAPLTPQRLMFGGAERFRHLGIGPPACEIAG